MKGIKEQEKDGPKIKKGSKDFSPLLFMWENKVEIKEHIWHITDYVNFVRAFVALQSHIYVIMKFLKLRA